VLLRPYLGREAPTPTAGDPFALPPITAASFRNASHTVGYVGSRACMKCHRDDYQSYLHTTHSRSMGEVDVAHEPPDGDCRHDLSGRSYRVYRDGATLRLREFIEDPGGREVVLADHAARYGLGSGNYSRMYLMADGDFLIETPVTWYPRRKTWGMSAGYEKDPRQPGFTRTIDAGCLYCHAGRAETIGDAGERLKVLELPIGCERCHGPGELHIAERRAGRPIAGSLDDSIVNLRHLSRDRQEDICSQCHLSASANIAVRGRSKNDFRPGMRMADFVVNYRIDRPDSAMTVSGQIEQMRLSRCYVQSKTMTCTTCHDPHAHLEASAKEAHYRNQCLSCHKTESCRLPAKARMDAKDYCVTCHMPKGPTDIPHFSFTHHRIGIHAAKPNDKLTEADQLIAVVDVSHFPEHEQQRLLGLATGQFAGKLAGGLNDETRYDPIHRGLSRVFHDRARRILEEVRAQGLRDAEVEDFFSRLHWRKNAEHCIEHARLALESPPISPSVRKSVVYNLASSYFDQGRYDLAFPYLEELAQCERSEITLMLLAICHQKKGDRSEAVRLIHEAIRAAPDRADLHSYLATIYREMGKEKDAEEHLQRAKLLRLKVPQPG
jgi:tetratricopeptide (TPR) repeat protein